MTNPKPTSVSVLIFRYANQRSYSISSFLSSRERGNGNKKRSNNKERNRTRKIKVKEFPTSFKRVITERVRSIIRARVYHGSYSLWIWEIITTERPLPLNRETHTQLNAVLLLQHALYLRKTTSARRQQTRYQY